MRAIGNQQDHALRICNIDIERIVGLPRQHEAAQVGAAAAIRANQAAADSQLARAQADNGRIAVIKAEVTVCSHCKRRDVVAHAGRPTRARGRIPYSVDPQLQRGQFIQIEADRGLVRAGLRNRRRWLCRQRHDRRHGEQKTGEHEQ